MIISNVFDRVDEGHRAVVGGADKLLKVWRMVVDTTVAAAERRH